MHCREVGSQGWRDNGGGGCEGTGGCREAKGMPRGGGRARLKGAISRLSFEHHRSLVLLKGDTTRCLVACI